MMNGTLCSTEFCHRKPKLAWGQFSVRINAQPASSCLMRIFAVALPNWPETTCALARPTLQSAHPMILQSFALAGTSRSFAKSKSFAAKPCDAGLRVHPSLMRRRRGLWPSPAPFRVFPNNSPAGHQPAQRDIGGRRAHCRRAWDRKSSLGPIVARQRWKSGSIHIARRNPWLPSPRSCIPRNVLGQSACHR